MTTVISAECTMPLALAVTCTMQEGGGAGAVGEIGCDGMLPAPLPQPIDHPQARMQRQRSIDGQNLRGLRPPARNNPKTSAPAAMGQRAGACRLGGGEEAVCEAARTVSVAVAGPLTVSEAGLMLHVIALDEGVQANETVPL
jgi:hypothetical protein